MKSVTSYFLLLLKWRVIGVRAFRFATVGRFPAVSQLSRFGACRVLILPLFPRESAVLRCIALFDEGWEVSCSIPSLFPAFEVESNSSKSVPFRCGRPLSSGSQLSRFGCACRVSTLPLFPKESAVLRFTSLFDA
ncbi:hypothetical protein KV679_10735 [Bacillus sp. JRC01]|nr:hypothetical protein [Bacillus sp. JRC01]